MESPSKRDAVRIEIVLGGSRLVVLGEGRQPAVPIAGRDDVQMDADPVVFVVVDEYPDRFPEGFLLAFRPLAVSEVVERLGHGHAPLKIIFSAGGVGEVGYLGQDLLVQFGGYPLQVVDVLEAFGRAVFAQPIPELAGMDLVPV